MKCIICYSDTDYYFSKTYTETPFSEFMRAIGEVRYYKCNHCGFVLSKTHSELERHVWEGLNLSCHHYGENPNNDKTVNQPPYAEQAMMLNMLRRNGIIDANSMIDYGAGYGTLSKILKKYYDLDLPISDRYVHAGGSGEYVSGSELKSYKTVINSAMFEHVLRREDLDRVNTLVNRDGCLIIHTVICENIPNDPDWFYLRPPVHTAFHTNMSMSILMEQWGYRSSIYCPPSKCWILFRQPAQGVENACALLNRELQSNWFYFKNGFVDYWNGF